ncbi:hypothetical protein SEA_DRYAD_81 [Streptomyces phage Dryad]|nr:hypothetical protein SEA_DRYAD_81 [Streptomyces phage Dryad]
MLTRSWRILHMDDEGTQDAWVTEEPPAEPVANPDVRPLWEALG